jgi:hypothetical protein
MVAVSEQGRKRFGEFPAMIADDLFIDSQFSDAEKAEVSSVEVMVEAPFTTRDLVRRLVRVRRGNAQLREAAAAGQLDARVRRSDRMAWLRDVVLRDPKLAPAAIPYVLITLLAGILAKRRVRPGNGWGRDESTRGKQSSATNGSPA